MARFRQIQDREQWPEKRRQLPYSRKGIRMRKERKPVLWNLVNVFKIDGEDLGHKLRARDKSILSTLFRDMVKYLTPLLSMYREKTVI